jgi:magnesium-transporting ATPase (P-type)
LGPVPNVVIYAAVIPISFTIGYFIKKELEEIKDFDWEPKNNFERIQNVFFVLTGTGVFYYFVLLSIMVLFFPWFENYTLWNLKLYHLVFISMAFIISIPKALRTIYIKTGW